MAASKVTKTAAPNPKAQPIHFAGPPLYHPGRVGFRERLRHAIGNRQNVDEVAKKLKVARSTVNGWLYGTREPRLDKLSEFAMATGVDLGWLVSGVRLEGYVTPQCPAGEASPLAFEEKWLDALVAEFYGKRPSPGWSYSTELIRVEDDAMEPALRKGDLVLVAYGSEPFEGRRNGIYALRSVGLRRVEWQIDGSPVISADNKTYRSEPRKLKREEVHEIIGPVVWRGGRI